MFDVLDSGGGYAGATACRQAYPNHYIKVNANNSTEGVRPWRFPSS